MSLKEELNTLRNALFDFSKRNSFVHIKPKNLWILNEDDSDVLPQKLFKKANYYWTEYGVETSLKVACFIKWLPPASIGKREDDYLISPLFYQPCKIKKSQKISSSFSVDVQIENYQVNRVLQHYFKLFYNYDFEQEIEDVELSIQSLIAFFKEDARNESINLKTSFDEINEWQIITKSGVGVFNYKKSVLGVDYEQIIDQPGNQINSFLTGERSPATENAIIDFKTISFLDASQNAVIKAALNQNTIIQGPPGTGKSHTIVALIGALLSEGKKILFVSEKRSALEVVANRLKKKGLGALMAYFNTDKDQKKAFYNQLKKSWEKHNESDFLNRPSKSIMSSENDLGKLYPNKVKGLWHELISVLLESGYATDALYTEFKVPNYDEWKDALEFLSKFESQVIASFDVESIANADFIRFNSVVFAEKESVLNIEKRLNDLIETAGLIQILQSKYELDLPFDSFIRLAITGSVLDMVNKVQLDLLNENSKKYASFNSWAKKYQLLKSKVHQAERANEKWTKKPSLSEITELLDLLSIVERKSSGRIFSRMKRNPAKLKTVFQDFHPGISNHSKIQLLESLKLEWRTKSELEETKIKLKHNLNIADPDHEIELIYNLRNKLNSLSQSEYLFILEHPSSEGLIVDLSKIHPDILKFNSQKRYLFYDSNIDSISNFRDDLLALKSKLPNINHWLPELERFFKLSASIRNFMREHPFKLERLNGIVAYQNLLTETRFEPHFKELSGWNLERSITNEQKAEKLIHLESSRMILADVATEIEAISNLLIKPSYKLSSEEKDRKKALKSSKRLLLHEMNKQQRHLAVKTLFESCSDYLLPLQPLWMMNPLTVSENLPCIEGLFDVVIFDESSQIPLEDAIPSIYRAKRAVIVGDSNQMPPASFFSSKEETLTVLDQAERTLNSEMLKWHYRSKHPQLIQFSNQEFYEGELITFPPSTHEIPIEIVECNGVFEGGANLIEAKEIALFCSKSSPDKNQETLIIAFSKEQEKAILKELSKLNLNDIRTRNLENAQGIEADRVIISLGYAKNEEGQFRMNFGPVNQVNGANRLNVLFTRAKEKMILFRSVNSNDFQLSANRGVQVLKDFLSYCETVKWNKKSAVKLPFAHQQVKALLESQSLGFNYSQAGNGTALGYFISLDCRSILLVDPGMNEYEIDDVFSFVKILETHFKAVKIVLSVDLWKNPDRVKKDIVEFFL